jgi:tetratricopeptide (TPR) repeat protein
MQFRWLSQTAILLCTSAFATQVSDTQRYFEDARHLFEQQRWDEAQRAAEKALTANPQNGDAETLLGLIATVRGQLSAAERRFSRATLLQPGNYRAHGYLGSTYLQLKQLVRASEEFQKMLELSPGNATANYNLGVIALARNSPGEALHYFELVTRSNSSDIPALIGKLESQLDLKQKQDAVKTALQLQRLLVDSDPRLFQVATLLAQHGESAAAIPMLERAQRSFPQSYDVNYNLALEYLQIGNYDRAALILQPLTGPQGKAEAFDLLGLIEEKRKRAEAAEQAFEKAMRLQPANEDYCFNYGNSLLQHGRLEQAITVFRGGVLNMPTAAKLHLGLGSAYYLSGNYQEAAEALLTAVRLKPDSATAFFLLGEAYDSAGALQSQIESAFKSYLRTRPRDALAFYHFGAILYTRAQAAGADDYHGAEANLHEALRLDPNLPEAHFELGLIALAQGRTEQAVAALKKAVSLDPEFAPAHYRLGLAYQRLGKADLGKQELERFRGLKNEEHYRAHVLKSLSSLGANESASPEQL